MSVLGNLIVGSLAGGYAAASYLQLSGSLNGRSLKVIGIGFAAGLGLASAIPERPATPQTAAADILFLPVAQ